MNNNVFGLASEVRILPTHEDNIERLDRETIIHNAIQVGDEVFSISVKRTGLNPGQIDKIKIIWQHMAQEAFSLQGHTSDIKCNYSKEQVQVEGEGQQPLANRMRVLTQGLADDLHEGEEFVKKYKDYDGDLARNPVMEGEGERSLLGGIPVSRGHNLVQCMRDVCDDLKSSNSNSGDSRAGPIRTRPHGKKRETRDSDDRQGAVSNIQPNTDHKASGIERSSPPTNTPGGLNIAEEAGERSSSSSSSRAESNGETGDDYTVRTPRSSGAHDDDLFGRKPREASEPTGSSVGPGVGWMEPFEYEVPTGSNSSNLSPGSGSVVTSGMQGKGGKKVEGHSENTPLSTQLQIFHRESSNAIAVANQSFSSEDSNKKLLLLFTATTHLENAEKAYVELSRAIASADVFEQDLSQLEIEANKLILSARSAVGKASDSAISPGSPLTGTEPPNAGRSDETGRNAGGMTHGSSENSTPPPPRKPPSATNVVNSAPQAGKKEVFTSSSAGSTNKPSTNQLETPLKKDKERAFVQLEIIESELAKAGTAIGNYTKSANLAENKLRYNEADKSFQRAEEAYKTFKALIPSQDLHTMGDRNPRQRIEQVKLALTATKASLDRATAQDKERKKARAAEDQAKVAKEGAEKAAKEADLKTLERFEGEIGKANEANQAFSLYKKNTPVSQIDINRLNELILSAEASYTNAEKACRTLSQSPSFPKEQSNKLSQHLIFLRQSLLQNKRFRELFIQEQERAKQEKSTKAEQAKQNSDQKLNGSATS